MKEFIEAGKIINTHGVTGEVKIEVWLDSPEFFLRFRRVYIGGAEHAVVSARAHKGFVIARLEGVNDMNAAMALKGRILEVLRADAGLREGEFFVSDIIGFDVVDEDGNKLGVLTDAEELPRYMLYTVKGESEHLIPAVSEFIRSIDAEKETITVHLIEGM